MAQFKNIGSAPLTVDGIGGVVAPNDVVTVDDALAEDFAGQSGAWQAVDTAASNAVTALSNQMVVGPPFIRAATR